MSAPHPWAPTPAGERARADLRMVRTAADLRAVIARLPIFTPAGREPRD